MTRFHQFIRRKDDRFYKSGKETISAANACRRRRRLLRHDVGARARRLANLRRTWTLDDPVSAQIVQERLSILIKLILAMIFNFFNVYDDARVLILYFTTPFWLQQPAAAISAANTCRRRLLRHDVGARARRLANLLRRTWTLDDPVSARIVQERLSILMILILAMIFIFFHVYGYARVLIPDFTATFWLQQPAAAISAANTCRRRLLRHDPGARARRLAELRRTTLMIDDPVSAQIG